MPIFRPAPPEELEVYGVKRDEDKQEAPAPARRRRAASTPAPAEQPVETPVDGE